MTDALLPVNKKQDLHFKQFWIDCLVDYEKYLGNQQQAALGSHQNHRFNFKSINISFKQ